ncbi:MAG: ribonuclease 3, partial [Proteobacteria bacterium]|nr:ribonuclease 3 [Pseudomonadota bacterium]
RRPTNLAHIYEAIVGAIFLDGGLEKVRGFVLSSLREELEYVADESFTVDPKSRLQEISQSRYQTTPRYQVVETEGPDHARRFTVDAVIQSETVGTGSGRSKQAAEKQGFSTAG